MTDSDIIKRVEKATGPDRELDALIECEKRRLDAYALGLDDQQRSHWHPTGHKGEVIDHQGTAQYHAPEYTRSLDAAISIIPKGWIWDVASTGAAWVMPDYEIDGQIVIGGIANPAIALCIAALKAHAALRARTQGE